MEPNYEKLAWGRSLQEIGPTGFITSSVCHNYGSISGCDEGCPDLLDGKCENPEEALEVCEIGNDEKDGIRELYPQFYK